MSLNRREFVALSSLGLIGTLDNQWAWAQAPAAAGQQPPTAAEFKAVRRNIGTFTARGGTIGYLITPDAVVVVDSQFADTAPMLLDGLKRRTTRKIDVLINSHHHPDHTGGNKVLQPSVTKIVAHENVPALQRRQAAAVTPKPIRPTPTRRSPGIGRCRSETRPCRRGTTGRRTPAVTSPSPSSAQTSSISVI